jgi:hypothetical protein
MRNLRLRLVVSLVPLASITSSVGINSGHGAQKLTGLDSDRLYIQATGSTDLKRMITGRSSGRMQSGKRADQSAASTNRL